MRSGYADPARVDDVFKALASAQRREILRILADADEADPKTCCGAGEVCACKLSESLGLAASTISHHMNALRQAGLVTARKDGQWVYYRLARSGLSGAMDVLTVLT